MSPGRLSPGDALRLDPQGNLGDYFRQYLPSEGLRNEFDR